MNKVGAMALRKQRWVVSFLLLFSLLGWGRAYPVAAHDQERVDTLVVRDGGNPATPRAANRRAKADLALHSISHPFPPAEPYGGGGQVFDYLSETPGYGFFQPAYAVVAGDRAVWYGAGVNNIRCSLFLPNVTWLGTDFGLKRLDNRAGTVQHFCGLDGLPYNKITALAGKEQQLYCSAEQTAYADVRGNQRSLGSGRSRRHRTVLALCRYHADSGKWERVAEATRNYPAGFEVGTPEQAKAHYFPHLFADVEKPYIAVGGNRACLVLGPGVPEQEIALVAPLKGRAAARILCPSFAKAPFRISFAHADAESLWIGSDLGLLRYAFKTQQWERLLPDLVITGGTSAEQGGLWLLTQSFDQVHPDRNGKMTQTEHCRITYFAQGKAPEHFALLDQENNEQLFSDATFFTRCSPMCLPDGVCRFPG